MKQLTTLIGAVLLFTAVSSPASAQSRDRQLKKLEGELATLESNLRQALTFRARYRNLQASVYFYSRLLTNDGALLGRVMRYLNKPISVMDAFVSSEPRHYERAVKARGRYAPGRATLWVKCRFGLAAVKARQLYTIRLDVVDSQQGARIYQSLGPYQRRVVKLIENIPFSVRGLKVARGRYQIRITAEVGSDSARHLVRYEHGSAVRPTRPTRPPPRVPGDPHTMGSF